MINEQHSLHTKIDSSWQEMLKYLSYADIYKLDDENSFLRYCFIAFFSTNKTRYQNIYTSSRENFFPIDIFLGLSKSDKNKDVVNAKIKELHVFLDFFGYLCQKLCLFGKKIKASLLYDALFSS